MNTRGLLRVLLLFPFLLALGCQRSATTSEKDHEPHERIQQGVRLSLKTKTAIGIETAKVTRKLVQETLSTTGWLAVKPGSEVTIKAATTGFVLLHKEHAHFKIGIAVTKEQELAAIKGFLSPQESAQLVIAKEEADIVIRQSQTTLKIAEERLKRLKNLSGTAVAETQLEDIEETRGKAKAAYEEAAEKLPHLPREPYKLPLSLRPVAVSSPLSGRVTALHVSPGQLVAVGDPLWTVSDWSTLWLHVPVFEGDLPKVEKSDKAAVTLPGTKKTLTVKPIVQPLPTEPNRRTVDIVYEVNNRGKDLRPGQALSVSLPLGKSVSRIVIPGSAVLWDGMGNSWVYVQSEKDVYRRQKIQLGRVLGSTIVVERGLEANQRIVVVGAQALFGEEFKGQLAVEDDD